MIGKALAVTMAVVAITGCRSSVADRLISEINQKCSNPKKLSCEVAVKDVTPFEWDKLYFFAAWTAPESISEAIGLTYQGADVPDDYTRILFVKGNKVVHEEDLKSLDYYSSTVYFPEIADTLLKAKTHFLIPANAVFTADKNKDEQACKGCFFYTLAIKN